MSKTIPATLTLDIISDISCPWCVIGYYRLETALEKMGQRAEIIWHPYEINPHLSEAGVNLIDNIIHKYGMTPDQVREMRAKITDYGKEVGFVFNYRDDMQVQSSLKAHQLLQWSKQFGMEKSHSLKQALFEAFFTHRENIADIPFLVQLASAHGLDEKMAEDVLRQDALLAEVKAITSAWQRQGISGVPSIIANSKYLTTGAQSVEGYSQWLTAVKAQEV